MWFWTASAADSRLFFWDDTSRQIRSWAVGTNDAAKHAGARSAITVDEKGTVWLGIGLTLYELEQNAASVQAIELPQPKDNAAAENALPSSVQGRHGVQGIDAQNGRVAVALSASSNIELYDNAKKIFSTEPIADGFEPASVAFFPDGSLAVGLKDILGQRWNKLLTIGTDHAQTSADVPDSAFLARRKHNGTVVSGSLVPSEADAHGNNHATSGPIQRGEFQEAGALQALSDGRLVGAKTDGVVIFDPQGPRHDVTFPTWFCGPHGGPPDPVCPSRPHVMATDGAGNIWVFTNGQSGLIGVLRSGTY